MAKSCKSALLTPIASTDTTHCLQTLLPISIFDKQGICDVSNSHYMEYEFYMGMNININMNMICLVLGTNTFAHSPRLDKTLRLTLKVTSIITNPNTIPSVWTFYTSVSKTMRYRVLLAATSFVAAFSWDNFIVCAKRRLEVSLCHDQMLVE